MDSRPYVQTFTAVVGNRKCPAQCPFCISKLTPHHVTNGSTSVNWRNFMKGGNLARDLGASTFLLTSKGEATLYPELVLEFIEKGAGLGYPVIELQTNGITLKTLEEEGWLDKWYEAGLTTVALSAVHYETEVNRKFISPDYPDLEENVKILKKKGREFCVRISCIMIKEGIDGFKKAAKMIQFCNRIGVDQLKLYPVSRPATTENKKMAEWVDTNRPDDLFLRGLKKLLDGKCAVVRKLVHGDTVYSWKDSTMEHDQNVAYGSCLTESVTSNADNEIRQLIYCRDGHIRYSWQYEGAILF